jgi:Immunity protein 49
MRQISFHEYDLDVCLNNIERQVIRMQRRLRSLENQNITLSDIATEAISYAGHLSQLRPCTYDTANALRMAAYSMDYAFILGRYPKQDHREEVFVPPAEPLLLMTTGPRGYLDAVNWIQAFYLACICRTPQINETLCKYPTELLKEASKHGIQVGEFNFVQVEMLKAFWRNDSDLQGYFIKAYEAAIKERDKDFMGYALNVASYEIQLFSHLHTEPEKFSAVLAEALERYKKYFFIGEEKRINNSHTFLAIGLLAMCSIAYMRDIPIEVESDYIPHCIIEQQFQEHPDDVICEAWAARPQGSAPSTPLNDSSPASSPQNPKIKQEIEISLESLPPEEQEKLSKLGAELAESQRQLDELEQSIRQSQ